MGYKENKIENKVTWKWIRFIINSEKKKDTKNSALKQSYGEPTNKDHTHKKTCYIRVNINEAGNKLIESKKKPKSKRQHKFRDTLNLREDAGKKINRSKKK